MASVFAPFCLASRCAASVSAVSPDCEMTTVSVPASTSRIAIAELAAVIHFDRNARQLLDHELARQRRVPARAAGDDLDLPEFAELFGRDVHFVQENAAGLLADAPQRGVAHGPRLLVNFLEHEMLVAAFFGHDGVPQDVRHLAVHRPAFEIAEPHAVGRQHRHVAIGQEKHVARVIQDGRHVGRHEILVVAQPDHHRGAGTRGDDLVRVRARDYRQRKNAVKLLDRRAHGLFQIAGEVLLYQVRDDLGIGLGFELVAFRLQLPLQRQVILDDAVMHHDDVALTVAVRVRVLLGGPPVRRPTRVPDAERAIHRIHADGFFKVAQLAGCAPYLEAAIAIHGQARRIVPPVFEALQPLQNDGNRFARSDVSYNATHLSIIGVRLQESVLL